MKTVTLSKPALKVIQDYLKLPFKNKDVSCPYFNNRKTNVRAALRVLIGKGSVKDIMEETKIISLREKVDLRNWNNEEIKKFLVDHNLGIDCSGFVYYVLDRELKAQRKGGIKKHIKFPNIKNPIRKLIAKIRTVENTGVKTLSHEANSKTVEIKQVKPGDFISILKAGEKSDRDHVLVIHRVDYENNKPKTLYYTHSLSWRSDGKYDHGVRQGKIEITDLNKKITDQNWIEHKKTGKDNETYLRAKNSKECEIRRLK
ncbi:MAG: hypothetical protein GF349_02330 [Candidatus Magasanikbacteria bacterium]|nr:hypothetical protein [Candidatus Magasanikbacteria bacterium]